MRIFQVNLNKNFSQNSRIYRNPMNISKNLQMILKRKKQIYWTCISNSKNHIHKKLSDCTHPEKRNTHSKQPNTTLPSNKNKLIESIIF
jgi:galactokinase/mevalonate kinase-like predicted kinase